MWLEPEVKSRTDYVSESAPNRSALRLWQRRYPKLAEDFVQPKRMIAEYNRISHQGGDNEAETREVLKLALSQIYNVNAIPVLDDTGFYPR